MTALGLLFPGVYGSWFLWGFFFELHAGFPQLPLGLSLICRKY